MDALAVTILVSVIIAVAGGVTAAWIARPKDHYTEMMNVSWQRIREADAQIAELRGHARACDDKLARSLRVIRDMREGVEILSSQIVEMDGMPMWVMPGEDQAWVRKRIDTGRLGRPTIHLAIMDKFNESEFNEVLFEMNVDPAHLEGSTFAGRIIAAINMIGRLGQRRQFIEILDKKRPHIEWGDLWG